MNMNRLKKITFMFIFAIFSFIVIHSNVYAACGKQVDVAYWTPISSLELSYNADNETIWFRSITGTGARQDRVYLKCINQESRQQYTINLWNHPGGYTYDDAEGTVGTDNLPNGKYICNGYVNYPTQNDKAQCSDFQFEKSKSKYSEQEEKKDPDPIQACSKFTVDKCDLRNGCQWNTGRGRCEDVYVANNPCGEEDLKRVLRFFGYILFVAKLLIPLIIIGFAVFDFAKSVVDKDEKSLTKQVRMVIIRIISGLIIFFLPSMVRTMFSLNDNIDMFDDANYSVCVDCVTKPFNGNCNASSTNSSSTSSTES